VRGLNEILFSGGHCWLRSTALREPARLLSRSQGRNLHRRGGNTRGQIQDPPSGRSRDFTAFRFLPSRSVEPLVVIAQAGAEREIGWKELALSSFTMSGDRRDYCDFRTPGGRPRQGCLLVDCFDFDGRFRSCFRSRKVASIRFDAVSCVLSHTTCRRC